MSRLRETAPRFAAEFVIVFLSVVLALLADDWRTTRDERSREREVLELLLLDLEEDASDMLFYREAQLPDLEAGDIALLRGIEGGASRDSLEALRNEAAAIWNYRPTYPTWSGIVQDGQLGLIQNTGLRTAIVDYHADDLEYLEDVLRYRRTAVDEAARLLRRHFGRTPHDSIPDGWVWTLRTSAEELRNDAEVLNALGDLARQRWWTQTRIDQLFLPRSRDLQEEIRVALGR